MLAADSIIDVLLSSQLLACVSCHRCVVGQTCCVWGICIAFKWQMYIWHRCAGAYAPYARMDNIIHIVLPSHVQPTRSSVACKHACAVAGCTAL